MPHVHLQRFGIGERRYGNRYRLRDGNFLVSNELEDTNILHHKSDSHPIVN